MTLAIQSRDYWDGAVQSYVASAEPFTALFCADAVALAQIESDMHLIDVATGPGALALAAEAKGAEVTAIDFSAAMIDQLRSRAQGRRIDAIQMDGQALDLPDGSFDRACSVFGIPLFPDWRAGLAEMARVLRPGGRAVVATASTPVGFGPYMVLAQARAALFGGSPATLGVEGMAALADEGRLVAEMSDAGFETVEVHQRNHNFAFDIAIFQTAREMLDASPVIADLAEPDRARVIDEAAHMAAESQKDGKLNLDCVAHFATAKR